MSLTESLKIVKVDILSLKVNISAIFVAEKDAKTRKCLSRCNIEKTYRNREEENTKRKIYFRAIRIVKKRNENEEEKEYKEEKEKKEEGTDKKKTLEEVKK